MTEKIGIIKNPLTIIAIFAGIAEVSGTIVLPFISQANQQTFLYFLIGFPILLVLAFFATLNFNHSVLYAPSDYKDEQNFLAAFRMFTAPVTYSEREHLAEVNPIDPPPHIIEHQGITWDIVRLSNYILTMSHADFIASYAIILDESRLLTFQERLGRYMAIVLTKYPDDFSNKFHSTAFSSTIKQLELIGILKQSGNDRIEVLADFKKIIVDLIYITKLDPSEPDMVDFIKRLEER
jgi:hypothetical protein